MAKGKGKGRAGNLGAWLHPKGAKAPGAPVAKALVKALRPGKKKS